MKAVIKRNAKTGKPYLIYGDKATCLAPERSPAFISESSERISVEEARHAYGDKYAAYVWGCLVVAPERPIYYAWTGVLNSLGHTGSHQPAWIWRDVNTVTWDDEIIAETVI